MFHTNINKKKLFGEKGEVFRNMKNSTENIWCYTNQDVEIKLLDNIKFWVELFFKNYSENSKLYNSKIWRKYINIICTKSCTSYARLKDDYLPEIFLILAINLYHTTSIPNISDVNQAYENSTKSSTISENENPKDFYILNKSKSKKNTNSD